MRRFIPIPFLAALFCAQAAFGEAPNPFPEFSAKRIKPPTAPIGERITIQIDPEAQRDALPAATAPATPSDAVTPEGQYAWFWDKVSPSSSAAGPGRLQQAVATLSGSTSKVSAPRLQHLQEIASRNGIDILRATIGTEVSPALVLAVIAVESAGRDDAVSRAGAEGLMQLMPDTATRFGVQDSLAPAQNITGGVKYLDWLMGEFDRDPILVLAGYNAGEGSVRKHEGVPHLPKRATMCPRCWPPSRLRVVCA